MNKQTFRNKNIVIGVTGGIACYKVLDLIKELRNNGADAHVIMTENSMHFVDIKDFEKASGNEVHTTLFHPKINYVEYIKKNKQIKHISLADIADLFLVCPATANIIGKIANGIADDLLSTSITATIAPVLICPAMNVKMWKNAIVQENVKKLKSLNYHFVEPEYGELACGYKGVGRLANLKGIIERVGLLLKQRNDLKGRKILVTAGATVEEIDPVRVITNKSSGKMGTGIAEQAFLRGADVFLLRGYNSIESNYNIKEEKFTTVHDLFDKIKKNIKKFGIVIHSAAVSDFAINNKQNKKIKSNKELHLELTPTTKIFERLKKLNKRIFLVGFKAEYNVSKNDLTNSAFNLLKSADADLVVANDVGKTNMGFDVDTNEVFVVDKNKNFLHIKLADKRIIADKILDVIVEKIK
ncbi:bifunctional phosphopantothenoylcysteine decarboxylase/phosphopantothenate--cysteine ligase CoaBC [Candidatus Woesearchaeota archaeon]|nr:bifunctional phosphopantothenoylcysteine decarboxylase/phosphopantothenate--cysteine ligase CoaBC [Candidatus Woesearchaeota archaeon]